MTKRARELILKIGLSRAFLRYFGEKRDEHWVSVSRLSEGSKIHYRDLDILRGVAALSVLILHLGESFNVNLLPKAYLAVDFFFILSGFVVAYAYQGRLLQGYGVRVFIIQRMIRLYPLVALGAVIGGLVAAIRLKIVHDPIDYQLLGAVVCGSLLIPSPFLQDVGNGSYFPMNNPTWSLFWEMLISIAFGLSVKYLNRRLLLLIVCGGALAFIAAELSGKFYSGWSVEDFWFGAIRVTFSFSVGVLLFRLRSENRLTDLGITPVVLSIVLLAAFAIPSDNVLWSNALDCLIILGVFPLVVAAGSHGKPQRSPSKADLLGRLSYPVYVLQFPFVRILGHWSREHQLSNYLSYLLIFISACAIVVGAWIVLVIFDEPIRLCAKRHFRSQPLRNESPTHR